MTGHFEIDHHGAVLIVRVDGGSDPVARLRKLHGFEAAVRRAAAHFAA